jgi:hypothetical protein
VSIEAEESQVLKSRYQATTRKFYTGGFQGITCACEAEESLLLEAVARERLVKTQLAGKNLACAVVISGSGVIACSSES